MPVIGSLYALAMYPVVPLFVSYQRLCVIPTMTGERAYVFFWYRLTRVVLDKELLNGLLLLYAFVVFNFSSLRLEKMTYFCTE